MTVCILRVFIAICLRERKYNLARTCFVYKYICISYDCLQTKIGGIFYADDEDAIKAFQIAVYRQNMYSKLFKFEAIVKEISGMDAFEAEQAG